MRCVLTRSVTLHARHRYHRADWSDTENAARFGPQGDAGGHGHLYTVDVSVSGPLDAGTQMIIDLGALDVIIAAQVVMPLDGQSLNTAVPEFASGAQLPSCEALASWIWNKVAVALPPGVSMHRVRVAEDDTLWADCIE